MKMAGIERGAFSVLVSDAWMYRFLSTYTMYLIKKEK